MNETLNILLVEDNPGDAILVKEELKESSYSNSTLHIAESLAHAIKFKDENILLLLVDLGLPDSDGVDTIEEIRKHFPDSAIIVLTGLDDEKVALETLRAGAQNYLNKNEISGSLLDRSIRFSLERHQIIQKLREAEKELKQSNFFLEKAQEVGHMGWWMNDIVNDISSWSNEAKRIFGFKPGEFDIRPSTFYSMIHPEDADSILLKVQKAIQEKKIFDSAFRIIRKDGIARWVHSQCEIEFDANGKPLKMIGSVQDITESKEAEDEIKKSNEQLHLLTMHLQQIREVERKRIGREIHDDLGQQLTAIKMDIAWIEKHIEQENEPLRDKLQNVIQLLDGSNQSIRRILTELRSVVLDDKGITEAIEWLGNQFSCNTGIAFQLKTPDIEFILPEDISTCIYRICQEALTNITRYSCASNVYMCLKTGNGTIHMRIEDDGKGFDMDILQKTKSFGILGMKERVHTLGGKFELISSAGNGTMIEFSLQLNTSHSYKKQ